VRATTTVEQGSARTGQVVCAPVQDAQELASHYRIRRAVFVDEQGLFTASDLDEHDDARDVVHVLATIDGEPVGTVRLYPLDPAGALWQGDRLAVLRRFRVHGAGRPLVQYAVRHAAASGGSRMVAHVQLPNVVFFRRLGWSVAGAVEDYVGAAHQPMEIALSHLA
jgi:putative N-acetyltransferase (TIGR04045 family)